MVIFQRETSQLFLHYFVWRKEIYLLCPHYFVLRSYESSIKISVRFRYISTCSNAHNGRNIEESPRKDDNYKIAHSVERPYNHLHDGGQAINPLAVIIQEISDDATPNLA